MSFVFIDDDGGYPLLMASNGQSGNLVTSLTFSDAPATGDLLLVFISVADISSSRTVTPPGGWSTLYNEVGNSELRRACGFWKISDSTETAPSFSISGSSYCAGSLLRYRGAISAETGSAVGATSAGPATFSGLTPTWGQLKSKWIAALHTANPIRNSSDPADYTNIITTSSTLSRIALADRDYESATDTPGNAALSGSTNWRTHAVGLRPTG